MNIDPETLHRNDPIQLSTEAHRALFAFWEVLMMDGTIVASTPEDIASTLIEHYVGECAVQDPRLLKRWKGIG